jgi:ABC-type branched-subunit amino acid transport system ATPase component/ABC-type branched-subunit amino acid transport system permease subunit
VAKAVASLGVMVGITGLILLRVGPTPVSARSIFSSSFYSVGSIHVPQDRIWFAVTVVVVTALVWAGYRFTRFGLDTRAAAETEKGAYVSGISPDRVAAYNWMIGAVVSGLAGILISPITPLVPYSYTLFIVPALAAAIFGGFQRMAPAVAAGLAIGMLQSEAQYLGTQHSWLPSSGLPELVPLVLIIVVLVVRAKPLPSRGSLLQPSLGGAPRPTRVAAPTAVGIALGVVGLLALRGSWREALVTSFILGIIALSQVVVTGYTGQVSLAQLTLAGVGAFLLSPLTTSWGIPFPIAPILAALGATVLGVVVGLPALRIRGLALAVVTLSFAVALEAVWFRNIRLVGSTGKSVSGPTLFGINLEPGTGAAYPRLAFCILALLALAGAGVGVARLRTSRLGRSMVAVRANERSAAASGINVLRTKLAAFAIAAFIAGVGGALLAYKQRTVTFDSFDVLLGLGFFATVYLSGISSVAGGLLAGMLGVGGLVYYITTASASIDPSWYQIASGIGLVACVIVYPDGLVGPAHHRLAQRRAEKRTRSQPAVLSSQPQPVTPGFHSAPQPRAPTAEVLSIRNLSVRYGGVVAVDDVSFDVHAGAIIGLIGPNGAGKTTLVDAVSGFSPYGGTVELLGAPIDSLPPYRRVRAGLGRTFQGLELWTDLTVDENVLVGHNAFRRTREEIDATFTLLGLEDLREQVTGQLSQGQRRVVSIARSLIANPNVLLLDEPAAGLDSGESAWLGDRLQDVRANGITVVLIDHDMSLVLNLCDRIEVLDFGRLIAGGTPQDVRTDTTVRDAYLGTRHTPAPSSAG